MKMMYALVSTDGTAMHETGLCKQHYKNPETRELALIAASKADDWNEDTKFVDVTENEYIYCIAEQQTIIQRIAGSA